MKIVLDAFAGMTYPESSHTFESHMGMIEDKLHKMGLKLPETHPYISPNRTHGVQVGNILYMSGHGSGRVLNEEGIRSHGKVGSEVSEEVAYRTARAVAVIMMAAIKECVGDLDRVKRVIRLLGMVNAAPGFNRHFAV